MVNEPNVEVVQALAKMTLADWVKVLTNPEELSKIIAGFLTSDIPQHVLATGRILGAARKHQLLRQLGDEINRLKERGQLRDDCLAEPRVQSSLLDLLQIIDIETPDDIKFKSVKAVFLYSLKNGIDEREKILTYELQKLCSTLSSGEIVVLKAAFELQRGINLRPYQGGMNLGTQIIEEWRRFVAFQIGHNDTSLVNLYEEKLIEKKLIEGGRYGTDGERFVSQYFRLTTLAQRLCEFIVQ